MPSPAPDIRALLAEQAEQALHALDASCAAISRWERERGVMRTLVNVGELASGDEAFPDEEVYELDAFPAVDALLRFGRPYVNPGDVSSAALMAQMRFGAQAGVPIVVEGRVWGELWVAAGLGGRALTGEDVVALTQCAEAVGRRLAAHSNA